MMRKGKGRGIHDKAKDEDNISERVLSFFELNYLYFIMSFVSFSSIIIYCAGGAGVRVKRPTTLNCARILPVLPKRPKRPPPFTSSLLTVQVPLLKRQLFVVLDWAISAVK